MTFVKTTWIIMPAMAGPAMTEAALADCLAQSVPVRILLILQGVDPTFRRRFEAIAEQESRLLVWSHDPPLPSLSATWNRALQFVWACGGEEALVVNNDVRLHRRTVEGLMGALNVSLKSDNQRTNLFVSAVGVTPEEFKPDEPGPLYWYDYAKREVVSKGGPDFSCFLISKTCHDQYLFDENFTPAFCEDLDYHRRLILDGQGDKIFSINLPYLHYGSQTIRTATPERQVALHRQIEQGSRAYYQRKWGGGGVNQERYTIPFDVTTDQDNVTTPDLQQAIQEADRVPAP